VSCWQCSEHWRKAAHRLLASQNHPEPLGMLTSDRGHRRTAISDSSPTLAWWWGLQAGWVGAHTPPRAAALVLFGCSPDLCPSVLRSLVRGNPTTTSASLTDRYPFFHLFSRTRTFSVAILRQPVRVGTLVILASPWGGLSSTNQDEERLYYAEWVSVSPALRASQLHCRRSLRWIPYGVATCTARGLHAENVRDFEGKGAGGLRAQGGRPLSERP